MYMGTLAISPHAPRIYLYHAYLAYMEAYGHQRSLSLTKFGKDFPKVMEEFGAEYKKPELTKGSATTWIYPTPPMTGSPLWHCPTIRNRKNPTNYFSPLAYSEYSEIDLIN